MLAATGSRDCMLCCAWLHIVTRHLCVGCTCAFCRSAVQAGWLGTRCQLSTQQQQGPAHPDRSVTLVSCSTCAVCGKFAARARCFPRSALPSAGDYEGHQQSGVETDVERCVQQLVHIAVFFVVDCGGKESYSAGYTFRSSCSCQQSAAVGAAATVSRVVTATCLPAVMACLVFCNHVNSVRTA